MDECTGVLCYALCRYKNDYVKRKSMKRVKPVNTMSKGKSQSTLTHILMNHDI